MRIRKPAARKKRKVVLDDSDDDLFGANAGSYEIVLPSKEVSRGTKVNDAFCAVLVKAVQVAQRNVD